MDAYPLSLRVALHGDARPSRGWRAALPALDNRDPARLAIVAMTGVTALVRGTAVRMEEKGVTYPGEKIRDWLKSADIAHISNEVSFYDNCRPPTRNDGTTMCSNWKYMELLRYVGTDIVELTGNHTWDYGAANLIPTIEGYEKEGWKIFGGGRNLEESRKPAYITVTATSWPLSAAARLAPTGPAKNIPGPRRCGVERPAQFDWMIIAAIKRPRRGLYRDRHNPVCRVLSLHRHAAAGQRFPRGARRRGLCGQWQPGPSCAGLRCQRSRTLPLRHRQFILWRSDLYQRRATDHGRPACVLQRALSRRRSAHRNTSKTSRNRCR